MVWLRRTCGTLLLLLVAIFARAETLTVLAAASLRESFTELARSFERQHPGAHVRITFAGSQQLAASILLDAPADVFASADDIQMKRVVDTGKAVAGRPLCANRLVIAVSLAAKNRIHSLSDLGRPGLRLVLAKPAVPAGSYAEKVLANLPASESRAIYANIVSRESDVRTVLTRVALGEADAGIVYATDVVAAGRGATAIPIPGRLQSPAVYEITALRRSASPGLAQAFMDLALSNQGQQTLTSHGFLPAPTPRRRR